MKYAELGKTGVMVSQLSFGTASLGNMLGCIDSPAASRVVWHALDKGITLFDTSPYYGDGLAEERLGKALRGRRGEVLIGTKAGRYGPDDFDFSPCRIRRSMEESLRLLRTDYVDIFQLHDVEFVELDGILNESYEELCRLRDEGKCRFIGMTGYPPETLRRVITDTEVDVVLCYAHFTLLDTCLANDLQPLAAKRHVGLINAAPLATGLLTSSGPKYDHPAGPRIRGAADKIKVACDGLGIDINFLASQFSSQRSGCTTTVFGTGNPAHVDVAVAALETPIDEEALSRIRQFAEDSSGVHWASGLVGPDPRHLTDCEYDATSM